MMTFSRKLGTSHLAVTSLIIKGNFNLDKKAESAVRHSFAHVVMAQ
jgi:hypothetical protein